MKRADRLIREGIAAAIIRAHPEQDWHEGNYEHMVAWSNAIVEARALTHLFTGNALALRVH